MVLVVKTVFFGIDVMSSNEPSDQSTVKRTISLRKYQDTFVKQRFLQLSKIVQTYIDELITDYKKRKAEIRKEYPPLVEKPVDGEMGDFNG